MTQQDVLDIMVQAAKTGGNQALAKQGMSAIVADDGGGGLTTQQDKDSEKSIVSILGTGFPTANILAEEKPDKRVTGNDFIVDPIDGSVNFATGGSDWSCTIAHTKEDIVDMAVIWQPRTQILVTAIRGQFLKVEEYGQERKLPPAADPYSREKSVVQMPIGREFSDDVIQSTYVPLIKNVRFVRNVVCNTGSIIELLLGVCDSFIGYGSIWDFAAGILFIEQFGGVATDYWGKPIDMNFISPQRVVLSRSQTIHDAIIPLTENWPTATEMRPKPGSESKSESEPLPQDAA